MNNLGFFRETAGLTKKELASLMNVTVYTYSGFEDERMVMFANIIQVLKSSNDCVKVKNEIDCCPRISSKLSYDKNKIVANFEPAVSIHGICIPQIADYKIYFLCA